MENTGQDMGRQQRRVFQHESRADHDSARLSWLRLISSAGPRATDIPRTRAAARVFPSSGKMAGLEKSCTWGIEDGSNRTTRGETVEIYSMVTLSIEDLHVSGAVPKSMSC